VRIAYCTNVRLPSERAHGHQIAQVCDALVHLGHEVEIFAPYRKNPVTESYWNYYASNQNVQLHHLGTVDFIASAWTPGVCGLFMMNVMLRRSLRNVLRSGSFDLLYTRTPALLSTLLASGIPTILELHQLPRWRRGAFVERCNTCRVVSCLTSPMRAELARWGVNPGHLIMEGDAVDLQRFQDMPSKDEARNTFGISADRLIVGYVGKLRTLGMEKGVGILLESLKKTQEEKLFMGLVVGGPEDDRRSYERMSNDLGLTQEDILFLGEIPSRDVPVALAACDVLVMLFPNLPHYALHMSPLKMFEYMASGKPIIASDLPTVRDVLSEESAFFFPPGDTERFVDTLRFLRDSPAEAEKRGKKARRLVEHHTWEERMGRILHTAHLCT
jgi:glycosyltransferase involved in cell wall biosynthesis